MPTAPILTVVEDVLYSPDGDAVNGRLSITNTSTMISPDGDEIPSGTTLSIPVINGAFSVGLVANLGSQPQGTSYAVKYQVTSQWFFETWIVPQHPNPAKLSDVRALVPPIPDIQIPVNQVLPPSNIQPGQTVVWDGAEWVAAGETGTEGTEVFLAAVDIAVGVAIQVNADGTASPVDPTNESIRPVLAGVSLSAAGAGHFFSAATGVGTVQRLNNSPGWTDGQKLYAVAGGAVTPLTGITSTPDVSGSPPVPTGNETIYGGNFASVPYWFVFIGTAQSTDSFLFTPLVHSAVPLGWEF